jgi:NarL family two-component system sensor histidine kinase YdfH
MQYLRQYVQKISLVRWILLLWIGVVYLWGIRWGGIIKEQVTPGSVLLFTLLMLLHVNLYGISSLLSTPSHWSRRLYMLGQALLVVLISLVAQRFTVTAGLYLALVGEMVSLPFTIPIALLVGATCLLLFSFNLVLLYRGRDSIPILLRHLVSLPVAFLYVVPLFLLVIGYTLLFTRQIRAHEQTQNLLQEIELAHRQLEDNAVRLEALTRSTERQRMARELHDTLAQGLAGLILQLEAVKAHLIAQREARALEIVIQAMGRARTSLAAARTAIDDLRAGTISPADLPHVLEEEIGRFTAATGIPCSTQLSSLALVPDALGESIVCSVAEGLLNVARHAQASQVWVRIAQQNLAVEVEVRDNGMGFDPGAIIRQGHYGLLGLRERTRLLGGQFALTTAPGEGTTIRLLLPATVRREDAL